MADGSKSEKDGDNKFKKVVQHFLKTPPTTRKKEKVDKVGGQDKPDRPGRKRK